MTAQEVEPLGEVHDPRLALVEGQPPGCQPLGEPRFDLLCLLLAVAEHRDVVGVSDQDRGVLLRFTGMSAGGPVADSSSSLQPVQGDVQ